MTLFFFINLIMQNTKVDQSKSKALASVLHCKINFYLKTAQLIHEILFYWFWHHPRTLVTPTSPPTPQLKKFWRHPWSNKYLKCKCPSLLVCFLLSPHYLASCMISACCCIIYSNKDTLCVFLTFSFKYLNTADREAD